MLNRLTGGLLSYFLNIIAVKPGLITPFKNHIKASKSELYSTITKYFLMIKYP